MVGAPIDLVASAGRHVGLHCPSLWSFRHISGGAQYGLFPPILRHRPCLHRWTYRRDQVGRFSFSSVEARGVWLCVRWAGGPWAQWCQFGFSIDTGRCLVWLTQRRHCRHFVSACIDVTFSSGDCAEPYDGNISMPSACGRSSVNQNQIGASMVGSQIVKSQLLE